MEFIGRERECVELQALLGDNRIVTLVGPGGVGKTRLAGEVGRRLGDGFQGGVLTSELSGMEDAEDIVPVVARQLGFESLDAVRVKAAESPTLVILDNCESALGQAATVAETLADDGSGIVVLATSRVPLQLPGERVVALDALDLPALDEPQAVREAAAAQLFLDRAAAAGANWSVTDENLLAIGRLVRQLDGLPLAIELAAARSRVLAPPELVRLLDRQLDLLARPGDESDRHRSLRSAIVTSYEPLRPDQQQFFRRLAIVSAPFDFGLAHQVAGPSDLEIDTVDALTELVDASLVAVRPGPDGGTEYRLLDSIRAFGREQLEAEGETAAAADRYIEAMTAFADQILTEALAAFTPDLLGRIRDRFVHVAAAIALCLDVDETADRAYRLFLPLYGPTGARTEVADLARRVRARWSEPAPLQAEALAVMAMSIFLSGTTEEAADVAEEAIEHPDGTALAMLIGYRVLGFAAAVEDRVADAKADLARAVELAESFSESFARELRISLAAVSVEEGDSPEAVAVLEEVSAAAARHDEKVNVAWAAVGLAYHHCMLDDLASARRVAESGLDVAALTGFPYSLGAAHRSLGSVLALDEGWSAAAPHYRSSLDVTLSVGDLEGAAITLRAAACAAHHLGDERLAAELWATVPPLRGRSVSRLIMWAIEDRLEQELGPPRGLDVPSAVVRARGILGPPVADPRAGTPEVGSTGVRPDAADGLSVGRVAGEPPVGAESDEAPVGAGGAGGAGAAGSASVLRFGGGDDERYELDLALHELRRAGDRVHVEPQVFDVLAHLAERRGTLVTKEQLLDEVWGDRFVSESALSSRIKAVRQATGDDGRRQRVIRTVFGKGFTFVAPVEGEQPPDA